MPQSAKYGGMVWSHWVSQDFGKCMTMSLHDSGGRITGTTFTLWEDLPFLAIETHIENKGREPLILNKLPVFQATFASIPAEKLKLLGTGGLQKPGKQVGSYMWLAAADPETRHGIVAGFLTTERQRRGLR